MSSISEWKRRNEQREQERIGDIYAECQKRGCDLDFLRAFDTRMALYPLRQTYAFIDTINNRAKDKNFSERIKIEKWKTYLEVYIALRPGDEKTAERKQALKLLQT